MQTDNLQTDARYSIDEFVRATAQRDRADGFFKLTKDLTMRTFHHMLAFSILTIAMASCTAKHEGVVLASPEASLSPGFNNIYHGGRMYFAGQPTPEGLNEISARGVTTVISLRTDAEHAERIEFDERAEVERLGMRFVQIPMTLDNFTPELVEQLSTELAKAEGPVLLHCGSSNRVGALWAAYLMEKEGYTLDTALAHGKAAGITKEPTEQAVLDYAEQYRK